MIKILNHLRIETERLILRQPEVRDIPDVVRNLSNLEVSKWLLVVPYPYREEDALWFINHCQEKSKQQPRKDYGYWMELKKQQQIIGGIGLHKVNEFQATGEVGYWLGADYHRKGYGSEALEALLSFAFNQLDLRRLEACVFVGNPSSGKLLEKYGFKLEGLKREAVRCKADGQIKDEFMYGLLRNEYKPREINK